MDVVKLTEHQLSILQHTLGCDQYGRSKTDRNYFDASPKGADREACDDLTALGLMRKSGQVSSMFPESTFFSVTTEGKEAMRSQSPSPPPFKPLTKAQQRYQDFLHADWWNGTFIEFLRWQKRRHDELLGLY